MLKSTRRSQRYDSVWKKINAIHPFREGNGRCQRMFIQLLSSSVGYQLDFMKISEEEMLEASVKSFDLDYGMLEELIDKALSIIEQ